MYLRIVPPSKQKEDTLDTNFDAEDTIEEIQAKLNLAADTTSESDRVELVVSDDVKFVILILLMCFVPLSVYSYGADQWGHRMGTHLGFATGVVCMWIGAYLLFVANWREHNKDS